jgi:hypothetical protein
MEKDAMALWATFTDFCPSEGSSCKELADSLERFLGAHNSPDLLKRFLITHFGLEFFHRMMCQISTTPIDSCVIDVVDTCCAICAVVSQEFENRRIFAGGQFIEDVTKFLDCVPPHEMNDFQCIITFVVFCAAIDDSLVRRLFEHWLPDALSVGVPKEILTILLGLGQIEYLAKKPGYTEPFLIALMKKIIPAAIDQSMLGEALIALARSWGDVELGRYLAKMAIFVASQRKDVLTVALLNFYLRLAQDEPSLILPLFDNSRVNIFAFITLNEIGQAECILALILLVQVAPTHCALSSFLFTAISTFVAIADDIGLLVGASQLLVQWTFGVKRIIGAIRVGTIVGLLGCISEDTYAWEPMKAEVLYMLDQADNLVSLDRQDKDAIDCIRGLFEGQDK